MISQCWLEKIGLEKDICVIDELYRLALKNFWLIDSATATAGNEFLTFESCHSLAWTFFAYRRCSRRVEWSFIWKKNILIAMSSAVTMFAINSLFKNQVISQLSIFAKLLKSLSPFWFMQNSQKIKKQNIEQNIKKPVKVSSTLHISTFPVTNMLSLVRNDPDCDSEILHRRCVTSQLQGLCFFSPILWCLMLRH